MSNCSSSTDLVKPFMVFKLSCGGNLSVSNNIKKTTNEEKKVMEEKVDRLVEKVINKFDRRNKSTIMAALFEGGIFLKGGMELMRCYDANCSLQFNEVMKLEKDIFISGILMRRFTEYDRCLNIMYETSSLTLDIMILVFSNKTEQYYQLIKRYLTDLQLHGRCKAENICDDTLRRSKNTNTNNVCPLQPTQSIRGNKIRRPDVKTKAKQDAPIESIESTPSTCETITISDNHTKMNQIEVSNKVKESFNDKENVKTPTQDESKTLNTKQNVRKTVNTKETENVKPTPKETQCMKLFCKSRREENEIWNNNDKDDRNNEEVNTLFLEEENFWPELLMKTQIWSANIEMFAINITGSDSNWLLKDIGMAKDQEEQEWREGCDRLFYNPITKKLHFDRDGPVLLYCGRQHGSESD